MFDFARGLISKIDTEFNKADLNWAASDVDMRRTTETSRDVQGYLDYLRLDEERRARYYDYDRMDSEVPEISSALDIYADNAEQGEDVGGEGFRVQIESASKDSDVRKAQDIVDRTDRLTGLRDLSWLMMRDTAKYGINYWEIVCAETEIWWLKYLPPIQMKKNFDDYGRINPEAAYSQMHPDSQQVIANFREFQIACPELMGDQRGRHGRSLLHSARKVFRQLDMIEDGMVIGRLKRSHSRYAYMVDVGDLVGEQAMEYVERIKKRQTRKRVIDPSTYKIRIKQDTLGADEDIFLPVSRDSKSDVKVLQGATPGSIADVEYFHNKMIAATKVPKAYLSYEGDVNARATLTEQDVQFARNIRRLQKCVALGIKSIYNVAFLLANLNPNELVWKIKFPLMATVDDLRRWQIEQIRATVAKMYCVDSKILPLEWVYLNLFKFSGRQVEDIKKMIEKERKEVEALQPPMVPGQVPGAGPQAIPPSDAKKNITSLAQTGTALTTDITKKESYDPNLNYSRLVADVRRDGRLRNILQEVAEFIDWKLEDGI